MSVNDYDLVILDVLLPLKDGFEVCRKLRAAGSTTPILMLTARDAVQAWIAGLDLGADDYLVKPFDFHELLARVRAVRQAAGAGWECCLEHCSAAVRKGVKVEIAPLDETPYRGDEGLLRQMFLNLLDNAVKYTPAGGAVRVSLARHDSGYEIIVTDTGVGIPSEAQPHIFERFFRADKARTRGKAGANGGAGLGLSIARWIAEAYNGQINLRHSDQRGSTFVIALPLFQQNFGRPARVEIQVAMEIKQVVSSREL